VTSHLSGQVYICSAHHLYLILWAGQKYFVACIDNIVQLLQLIENFINVSVLLLS